MAGDAQGNDQARVALADKLAWSIEEFAQLHSLSRSHFFNMRAAGVGPSEMRCGSKVLISREAAARWRIEREAQDEAAATR